MINGAHGARVHAIHDSSFNQFSYLWSKKKIFHEHQQPIPSTKKKCCRHVVTDKSHNKIK